MFVATRECPVLRPRTTGPSESEPSPTLTSTTATSLATCWRNSGYW
ncbi:hypothetical protein LINPERHAP1_LOCUS7756 [Linum perenne]